MKALIAQLNPTVGAVAQNLKAMLAAVEAARTQQAQLVIFPEMAVSGYPPKDLLAYREFTRACLEANTALIQASDDSLMIVWGNIAENKTGIGKALHNAGYVALGGKLLAMGLKSHLPTYDVFDEARYFEPGTPSQAAPHFTAFGKRFTLTICEDLWSHPCFSAEEKANITPVEYATTPWEGLSAVEMDVLLNISASPYVLGKPQLRSRLLKRLAAHQGSTVVYVNQVGANDDLIFDGHSLVTQPAGQQWVGPGFAPGTQMVDLTASVQTERTWLPEAQELIDALTLGIGDYVNKTGFDKVFIGLSGGVDSSLTATLAHRALGAQRVIGVAMPGPYSSHHSLEDARLLAQNLGIEFREHSINAPFQSYLNLLSQGQRLEDLAEQNLQARLRGVLLMTLANRENALVLATGNKSETATGYSTLYGDSCGALAPIGDLYKTQVYQLCEALNLPDGNVPIPRRVLEKPPSAELAPNQVDADTLPPYPVLDELLKRILEEQLGFGELLDLGYDKTYVTQTLQRVMGYEYKRQQMPPSLKVSLKAFGSGRVFPIVQQIQLPPAITLCPT